MLKAEGKSFLLKPFQKKGEESLTEQLRLTGTVARSASTLHICYELTGPVDEVLLPARNCSPRRRDGLWQGTCFEFLVAVSGLSQYREINQQQLPRHLRLTMLGCKS